MSFNTQPDPRPNDYPESWNVVKADLKGESMPIKLSNLALLYDQAVILMVNLIAERDGVPPEVALEVAIKYCDERNEFGKSKYKTPLQPFNGRNSMADAVEESLDLVVYLRNEILERTMQ